MRSTSMPKSYLDSPLTLFPFPQKFSSYQSARRNYLLDRHSLQKNNRRSPMAVTSGLNLFWVWPLAVWCKDIGCSPWRTFPCRHRRGNNPNRKMWNSRRSHWRFHRDSNSTNSHRDNPWNYCCNLHCYGRNWGDRNRCSRPEWHRPSNREWEKRRDRMRGAIASYSMARC